MNQNGNNLMIKNLLINECQFSNQVLIEINKIENLNIENIEII